MNGGTFKRENANATEAMFDYIAKAKFLGGTFSGADGTNQNKFFYGAKIKHIVVHIVLFF